jgi:hypothetical protein
MRMELVDACTPGLLAERIWSWARGKPSRLERLRMLGLGVATGPRVLADGAARLPSGLGLRVELGAIDQRQKACVSWSWNGAEGTERQGSVELEIPFPAWMLERQQGYAVEKLLTIEF